MKVQVLVTQRCNALCLHCDKAVGLAHFHDMEMTQEKMSQFVTEALDQRVSIERMSVSGGEPVVNRDLQGILDEMSRLNCPDMPIYSNGMPATADKRAAIHLPDARFYWEIAPLDNPLDPRSGKTKHIPYFISPADLGVDSMWEKCSIRKGCGRGLDVNGWSMCGQAPILGRLLGINPYKSGASIHEQVNTPINDICRHCVYGTGHSMRQRRIMYKGMGMTETYCKASFVAGKYHQRCSGG